MKIIAYLLAIYMFALAFVPCSDGGSGLVEIIYHLSGVAHDHPSSDHDHSKNCGDDFCSPFCICSCCSSALDTPTEPAALAFYISLPRYETVPVFTDQHFLPGYHPSIWQPPRRA